MPQKDYAITIALERCIILSSKWEKTQVIIHFSVVDFFLDEKQKKVLRNDMMLYFHVDITALYRVVCLGSI